MSSVLSIDYAAVESKVKQIVKEKQTFDRLTISNISKDNLKMFEILVIRLAIVFETGLVIFELAFTSVTNQCMSTAQMSHGHDNEDILSQFTRKTGVIHTSKTFSQVDIENLKTGHKYVDLYDMFDPSDTHVPSRDTPTRLKEYEDVFRTFPNYQNTAKYLVYVCESSCGGLSDRLKGIINVYILSVLSRRRFAIRFTTPCALETFLLPNLLDWRLDGDAISNMTTQWLDYMQDPLTIKMRLETEDTDLEAEYKADVTYMKHNQEWIDTFRKMSITAKNFPQLYSIHNSDFVRIVYYSLFKPTPQLNDVMSSVFDSVNGSKLACLHLRMGDNSRLYQLNRLTLIWKHLQQFYQRDDYKIFIATDSNDVHNLAHDMFSKKLITVNSVGPVAHIDNVWSRGTAKDAECSGFLRAMVDHAILRQCDNLVLTYSGFGIQAAHLRHSSRGLAVFFNTHGVFPVRREEVRYSLQHTCSRHPYGKITMCD